MAWAWPFAVCLLSRDEDGIEGRGFPPMGPQTRQEGPAPARTRVLTRQLVYAKLETSL